MRSLLACLLVLALLPVGAADPLPGPTPADLVRVVDGDTVEVRARIWLDEWIGVSVRLSGIDAPELHGRCPAEREKAAAARDYLSRLIEGHALTLEDISPDKYAGRVEARLLADGQDTAAALLADGLARPLEGAEAAFAKEGIELVALFDRNDFL